MPVVYNNTVKTDRSQVVIDWIGATGLLVIGTSALAGTGTGVLAEIPLANPSFTQVNGAMTMANAPRTVNAIGAGTAAKAEIRGVAGAVIINGLTVGVAGSGPGGSNPDVVINATSISVGQSVQAVVGTITPTS